MPNISGIFFRSIPYCLLLCPIDRENLEKIPKNQACEQKNLCGWRRNYVYTSDVVLHIIDLFFRIFFVLCYFLCLLFTTYPVESKRFFFTKPGEWRVRGGNKQK